MHLTPREQERLTLFTAAELARRRLARGSSLGASEAIAYVCDEILELAWDGVPYDEIVASAAEWLRPPRVLADVPAAVPRIQVEALFPYGSALVSVERPFGPVESGAPGSVVIANDRIALAPGAPREMLVIRNGGDRMVWVSSHFPLPLVNRALEFDRVAATGYRLDLPAGTAAEFPPGETIEVRIVRLSGGGGVGRVDETVGIPDESAAAEGGER